MKYRKKPVVIEATQWFKHGDHREVFQSEVRQTICCKKCKKIFFSHGHIRTNEGYVTICPGDWIITDADGNHRVCKPDIFEATYDEEPTE